MKHILSALALAAAFIAPAQAALNNAGFDSGTTNWSSANGLSAVSSASVDYLNYDGTNFSTVNSGVFGAVSGSGFGLWTPTYDASTGSTAVGSLLTQTVNYAATGVTSGFVYLRLFSSDYWWTPDINDSVTVEFLNGSGTVIGSGSVASSAQVGPDSSWQQFSVASGTEIIRLTLTDQFDAVNNIPTVAIDFSATAVPEPSALAMMFAGMGALALKGRRRQKSQQ